MGNLLSFSYIYKGGARFDILKFLLSLIIVAMHSGLFSRALLPIARLAVPLFFIMTSYFFHLKLSVTKDSNDRKHLLKRFIRRNVQLYIFWSIVLLPFIFLFHLSWFENGFFNAIMCIIKSFIITGFFPASWFILASIFSVLIVFFFSKWLNNGWLFIIALALYILALLDSNYGGVLSEEARMHLASLEIRYSLNLPAALIWIVIGKIIAENNWIFSRKVLMPALIVFLMIYYVEFFIIEHFGWSLHTDCFLTSIPLCTLIFIAIGQSPDFQCKHALFYRKSSIILYCIHLTGLRLFDIVSSHLHKELNPLLVYLFIIVFCLSIAWLIIYCCENKSIKFLRYAY